MTEDEWNHASPGVKEEILQLTARVAELGKHASELGGEILALRAAIDDTTVREIALRAALEPFILRQWREVYNGIPGSVDGGGFLQSQVDAGRAALAKPSPTATALLAVVKAAVELWALHCNPDATEREQHKAARWQALGEAIEHARKVGCT